MDEQSIVIQQQLEIRRLRTALSDVRDELRAGWERPANGEHERLSRLAESSRRARHIIKRLRLPPNNGKVDRP